MIPGRWSSGCYERYWTTRKEQTSRSNKNKANLKNKRWHLWSLIQTQIPSTGELVIGNIILGHRCVVTGHGPQVVRCVVCNSCKEEVIIVGRILSLVREKHQSPVSPTVDNTRQIILSRDKYFCLTDVPSPTEGNNRLEFGDDHMMTEGQQHKYIWRFRRRQARDRVIFGFSFKNVHNTGKMIFPVL